MQKCIPKYLAPHLSGVYDTDKSKCDTIVAQYPGLKSFSTLDDLLANVDAVSVATVTSQHFEVAKRALNAGVHVLIEKLYNSIRGAKRMS